jgi:hypothetical protein
MRGWARFFGLESNRVASPKNENEPRAMIFLECGFRPARPAFLAVGQAV